MRYGLDCHEDMNRGRCQWSKRRLQPRLRVISRVQLQLPFQHLNNLRTPHHILQIRDVPNRDEVFQAQSQTAPVQREIQRPHVARLIGVQQSDANRRLMAHVLTTFTCSRSDNKFTWKGQWSLSAIERDIFVNHAAAEYIFRPKDSFNMCSLDFLSCCPLAILSQSE